MVSPMYLNESRPSGNPFREQNPAALRLMEYGHDPSSSGTLPSSGPERSPIMKKSLKISLIALAALCFLAGTASPQAPKKADIVGTWVGTAVVGDGSKIDITAVIEKAATGYSGKLGDASGQVPESQLKEIVFKDNKLSFDFDFAQGSETVLIK